MPFDLKALIKKADSYTTKVEPVLKIEETKQEIVIPEIVEFKEPEQVIELPVYEPDSEPEVDNTPVVKRKVKNEDITRKVSLNPLSDE